MTTWATLGEKRAELLARLGFASSGAAAGVIRANVDSILRTSQKILYDAADWVCTTLGRPRAGKLSPLW